MSWNVNTKGFSLICLIVIGLFLHMLFSSFFAYSWTPGPNYRNVTIDSKLNISGSTPDIIGITLQNPITLSAGVTTMVSCNISILDYNGFADIQTVNATIFHTLFSNQSAADDNNTHYTNSSCSPVSQSGIYANLYLSSAVFCA